MPKFLSSDPTLPPCGGIDGVDSEHGFFGWIVIAKPAGGADLEIALRYGKHELGRTFVDRHRDDVTGIGGAASGFLLSWSSIDRAELRAASASGVRAELAFVCDQCEGELQTLGFRFSLQDLYVYVQRHEALVATQDMTVRARFNEEYYLAKNPDVAAAGIDAFRHYNLHGWREGRDPSPTFSIARYLRLHPDVKASEMEPLRHYVLHGLNEGRGT